MTKIETLPSDVAAKKILEFQGVMQGVIPPWLGLDRPLVRDIDPSRGPAGFPLMLSTEGASVPRSQYR